MMEQLHIYGTQIAFIICAIIGGIAHWLKKVARKETTATFTGWFGKDNAAASIYTMLVFIFVIIGALAGDIINEQTGFWAALYTGFATGFAIDSGFNSDNSRSLTGQIVDVRDETRDLIGEQPIGAKEPAPQPSVVQLPPTPAEQAAAEQQRRAPAPEVSSDGPGRSGLRKLIERVNLGN